jgi:hypothetical protein
MPLCTQKDFCMHLEVPLVYTAYMNRSDLDKLMQKHVAFILQNINFESASVHVHINGKRGVDLPRAAFILYALSNVLASGHAPQSLRTVQNELVTLFWKLFQESERVLSDRNKMFMQLYGMRFLKNLGEDYSVCVDAFSRNTYEHLFTYPVQTYVFISACHECPEFIKKFPYTKALLQAAYDTFDFWLHTDAGNALHAFHFSEISAWDGTVPHSIQTSAAHRMNTLFLSDIEAGAVHASGIAKCMEHWARVGDVDMFERGMQKLQSRSIAAYSAYLHPAFERFADILYTETDASQYVCLDTSGHLINAYTYLYGTH